MSDEINEKKEIEITNEDNDRIKCIVPNIDNVRVVINPKSDCDEDYYIILD